jgi:apolipoprotein N-acyltransferase
MQVSAVTGIWGVVFLVTWCAGIVAWSWDQHFEWSRIGPVWIGYSALLAGVLLAGGIRLERGRSDGPTIRVAAVSFPRELFAQGEVTRIYEGQIAAEAHDTVAGQLSRLQDWFLERTTSEARAGAQLVAWPETNLLVLRENEEAFVQRASQLAARERIHLAMGMATVTPGAPHPLENKIVMLDPQGRTAFSYRKSKPVPGWEASLIVPGDGHLPILDTDRGRVAAAICFDADDPRFVRQVGQAHADLWVLPTNDWAEIKRSHFQLAAFRAIENGTPLLRAGSSGFSGAFDAFGRVLAWTDHFSGARTMVAQIPVGGVPTLYARFGDWFAWLCVAGLALMIARLAM